MGCEEFSDQAGMDGVTRCEQVSTNGNCNPAKALDYKEGLPTKHVMAPDNTSKPKKWAEYQMKKCGNLEYNIYDVNLVTAIINEIQYELGPRSAIFADGLAHKPPSNAHPSYKFGCCLLEAKYSQADESQALYISKRKFTTTKGQKWWLKHQYKTMKNREFFYKLIFKRFKIFKKKKKKKIKKTTFQKFAESKWDEARKRAVVQLGIYASFCLNKKYPYTNYLVICGEKKFVANYFKRIASPPGRVVHSPLNKNDWKV